MYAKAWSFLIFLLLLARGVYAGVTPSARALGTGGTFCAFDNDAGCLFYNPAGTAGMDKHTLSAGYMPVYSVRNCHHFKTAGSVSLPSAVLGFSCHLLSFHETYTAGDYLISGARVLNSSLEAGVSLRLSSVSVALPEEEKDTFSSRFKQVSADAGILVHPAGILDVGASVRRLPLPYLSSAENCLSREMETPSLLTGIKINPSEWFSLGVDLEWMKDKPVAWKTGGELLLYDTVAVRLGRNTYHRYSFGLGVDTPFFSLDAGFQHHPGLGYQYLIDITGRLNTQN